MIAHLLTADALTIFEDGKVHTLPSSNRSFNAAVEAVRQGDLDTALKLACPARIVIEGTTQHPDFKVAGGVVTYQGTELRGYDVTKLLEMLAERFPIDTLVNFIVRKERNPSSRAVNELYPFLEKGDLPLLPDGRFIAYKRINSDWTDCHTSSVSNAVGTVVSMPRNKVDDNPNHTCSHGLHVCSMGYLADFGGERVVAVAVAPEDVVSVPVDYDAQKMRVCQYEVLAEIQEPTVKNPWGTPVVTEYEDEDEEDYEEEYEDEIDAA
jgi:hypothetical protein